MSWIDSELVFVSLAAMLSPTTLTFSVLTLVLGDRPLRTGSWFYLGAVGATLAVGLVAAFVLGDVAASHSSTPKTWVAVVDILVACIVLVYVAKTRNKPLEPEKVDAMVARMSKVAASPAIAVIGAGAVLANPGAFIPIALKTISETDPTTAEYLAEWALFTFVSLLPLSIALFLLVLAPHRAKRLLTRTRDWLITHARTVAAVILVLLAANLLRNGIAGLT